MEERNKKRRKGITDNVDKPAGISRNGTVQERIRQ